MAFSGMISRPWSGILAEIGSFQMEYSYLAHLTGNKSYFDRVARSHELFKQADLSASGGMLPTSWSLENGTPNDSKVSTLFSISQALSHTFQIRSLLVAKQIVDMNIF
jgi:mannosyl-oligosaccharide alpha-1,2-mannosidase